MRLWSRRPRFADRGPFLHYSFLHGLGRMAPGAALDATRHAMRMFASPPEPQHQWILLDMASDHTSALDQAFQAICSRYGRRHETRKGYHIDGPVFRCHAWPLPAGELDSALAEAERLGRSSEVLRERVKVQAMWKFSWLDPDSGALLPNQRCWPEIDVRQATGSSLLLTLDRTSAAALWFYLPFESVTEECREYVRRLQAALPVRLSDKHWRIFRRNAAGEWRPHRCNPLE